MTITLTFLFWIHNLIFMYACAAPALELLTKGGTSGQLNLIPLILVWIAGSLTWGLGAVAAGLWPPEPEKTEKWSLWRRA